MIRQALNTAKEIETAVDAGKTVHWKNPGYRVIKDNLGQYLVTFPSTGWAVGLTEICVTQDSPGAYYTLVKPTFKNKFSNFVCEGDSINVDIDGTTYVAIVVRDEDTRIDDDDCHNTNQSVTGCNDEQFIKLMEARNAWQNDEWFYCGIIISAERDGWVKEHLASLWAIEANYPDTDNTYLFEVANELLAEAFEEIGE